MGKANNTKTLTWNGASRLASNVSARTVADPQTYVEYVDLITDGAQRIRKRPGKGASLGAVAASPITALHEFERVHPTTGAVTYHIFGVINAGGFIYKWNGAAWAAETLPVVDGVAKITSGAKPVFCNFNNRCYFVNGVDEMIVYDGTSWKLAGVIAPVAAATYAPLNLPAQGIYNTGTVSVVEGSPTVTGVVPAQWTTGGAWNLFYIDIDGTRYQISTVATQGDGAAIAPVLTLTEGYKGATASPLTYSIYTGLQSWGDNPPKYSWAYYNPTTGHVSNRAPITEITEKNIVNRTITLTIAATQDHQDAYGQGYTKIKIFRTASEGNQLAAIDTSVDNVNSAVASISFPETTLTYQDTKLTNLAAPLNTNTAPPSALSSLTAHLNRLWATRPSDPTNTPPDTPRTYFSAVAGEIPFGVPEESWPRRFARSGISQPKDVVTMGADSPQNALVIVANDGNYTVDGYDNRSFTDPYRLPMRTTGGFFRGTLVFDGRLVQMYRDKRLLDTQAGDLGAPIQDKLNRILPGYITQTRFANFAYENSSLMLVSYTHSGTTNNYSLVYDWDNGRINEWNFGITAAATVHNASGALELWVGDATGAIYSLLVPATWQDAGANFAPHFKTSHIDFDRRVMLCHARLYVGPTGAEALTTWKIKVFKNEDTVGTEYTFTPSPDLFQSAQGREMIVNFPEPIFAEVFQAEITFPSADQDLYVERFELDFTEAQDMERDV